MNSLKEKGVKAFAWDFLGKLSTQGMGFVVTIFLARLLEPSDFGLIAMIMIVIGVAQVFSDIGLGGALIQRRKLLPIHYSSVFYFNIFIASFLTCITYFSSGYIAEFYNNNELISLTQATSVLFVINAFSSVQTIRLRRELNYALLTKVSFISSIVSGILGVTCAFNGAGVWSLVAQIVCQGVLYNVIIWSVTAWTPSVEFSFKALKQLWSFGFRMFLVGLIEAISTRMDFLIIGKMFPVATLGYFQRAKSLNTLVVQYASSSLMTVLFPLLSQIQNDLVRFRSVVIQCLNLLSFFVFILVGCLYLSSEDIITFFFSDKWLPSVSYLKLLIISAFAYPINSLLVSVLSSRGDSKSFLKMAIIKKAVFFSNLGLAFSWGVEGYLKGLILVSIINTAITMFFSSREMEVKFLSLLKPVFLQCLIAFISLVAAVNVIDVLSIANLFEFIFKNCFFVFVFFVVNFLFKTDSLMVIKRQISIAFEKFLKEG